ncbi:hypothetical protein VNO80_01024 [Phaseolus coccineus]|uniref:Cytochrome P450 n=1 Tax=Phaseolus coccineus TaxID=3886 RepID=A0AAN9P3C3_PHACN
MVSPVLILCLILPVLFLFFFQYRRTLKNPPFPPGPRGLPIIGNLHQLDNSNLYLQLYHLSQKYGSIFSIRLGLRPAIVVSSAKLARELFKDNDPEVSDRPKCFGQQRLSYDGLDMIFSQYGQFWREIRKICVVHILGTKSVSKYYSIRVFELKRMMKKLYGHASSSKVTNLNEMLMSLTTTIICRIVFGRGYDEEGAERSRFHGMFNECQAMWATFFVSDYIPFLGWVDKLTGLRARLEKNFKDLDKFYEEVLAECIDPNRKTPQNEGMIDVLIQLKKESSSSLKLTNNHIKAILMDMLLGATDTTSATAVWAMTALLKNPRVMKKVQEEIRTLGGKKEFLEDHDVEKFLYLKAVIKEVFRLYPAAPTLVARETNKACMIGGYEIPAKTILYVNAWAIHRNPESWKDPEEFLPERFLDSTVDFHGNDFELIPFGAGRRICPGLHMAAASLHLILANILNSFDWELPAGVRPEDIDEEMLPGLAQHKKNPLYVLAKPRI